MMNGGGNGISQNGAFRSGPIRATAFDSQFQNFQLNNNSDMHGSGIGGTSKAKQGGSQSLINNRPGTAPKRPASPGAQLL